MTSPFSLLALYFAGEISLSGPPAKSCTYGKGGVM
jgi:hypothetical protein